MKKLPNVFMNFIKNQWDIIAVYLSTFIGLISLYQGNTTGPDSAAIMSLATVAWCAPTVLFFSIVTIVRTLKQNKRKIRLLWLVPYILPILTLIQFFFYLIFFT